MAIDSYPSPPSETTLSTPSTFNRLRWHVPDSQQVVRICLKDGHDTSGSGMTCEMPRTSTFANVFGHFKARSCKDCRAPDEMRFKKDGASVSAAALVSGTDTPEKLRLNHGNLYTIRVWSNVPGLQCASCKRTGYPKTVGIDDKLHATTPPACTNAGASETLTLAVKDQTGFEMSVKMLNTTTFTYLIDAYSTQALREKCVCRFLYDGEKLMETETPKKLAMINGDTVDVLSNSGEVEQSKSEMWLCLISAAFDRGDRGKGKYWLLISAFEA